jgi:hypothetical protein
VIKSRRVRHITHREEMRNAYKILVRKPERRDHLGILSIDGMIILKLILNRSNLTY